LRFDHCNRYVSPSGTSASIRRYGNGCNEYLSQTADRMRQTRDCGSEELVRKARDCWHDEESGRGSRNRDDGSGA
jgi:hypothetical protein